MSLPPKIPHKDLKEGIRLCRSHIENLIETADVLIQNKKYLSSIPFSVLGMEHYGYLLMLQQYYDEKKDVSISQWNKRLTHHPSKLKFAYEESHPDYRVNSMRIWNLLEIPEKTFMNFVIDFKWLQNNSPKSSDVDMLMSFNSVKKDVFYINYMDNWFSIYDKLSIDEQEAMANVFLISIKYDFLNHSLSTFYPSLDVTKRNSIKRHPIYKKMILLEKEVDHEKFSKYRKLTKKVISKYYVGRP